MIVRKLPVRAGRIDAPVHAWDDLPVCEVTLQVAVVRVEQACATLQGKSYDVLVIGLQKIISDEIIFAFTDPFTSNQPYPPAQTTRFHQPKCEFAIARQFVQHPASYDKLSRPIVQPFTKLFPRARPLPAEHFKDDIRIDYGAHQ